MRNRKQRYVGREILNNPEHRYSQSFSKRRGLSRWLYGVSAIAVTAGILYGSYILRTNSPTEIDIRGSTAMLHTDRDSLEVSCVQYDSSGLCGSYRNPRDRLPQIDIPQGDTIAIVYTSKGRLDLICRERYPSRECKTFKAGYIRN